ncbi:MAG: hypothetical protein AAFY41_12580, partial [Bacteroidota bacterium]
MDHTKDELLCELESNNPEISILGTLLPNWGKSAASAAIRSVKKKFDFGAVVGIGIAGNLSSDLSIGDVCHTGKVIDILERSKVFSDEDTNDNKKDTSYSSTYFETPNALHLALNLFRTNPGVKDHYNEWQITSKAYQEKSLKDAGLKDELGSYFTEMPKARNGDVICGPVLASGNEKEKIKSTHRHALAIETEAGGIFEAAKEVGNGAAVVIRGISDPADDTKSKFEAKTRNLARKIAATNAATFLRAQLNNDFFVTRLKELRNPEINGTSADLFGAESTHNDTTLQALEDVKSEIDAKLRELSFHYRFQPKGFQLPTPRIKEISLEPDPRYISTIADLEIICAISSHASIAVSLDTTYPDNSLPWVIACELCLSTIADKQAFPVVVNGANVRPPKNGFLESSSVKTLPVVAEDKSTQVVFIVVDFPIHASSRWKFFLKEAKKYEGAKFI